MAYEPIPTEELKKLVMMGRKRPMNMAYNPGPKGADLLIIERIKTPEVIGRLAKKEGEGPKVAFGTFEIKARKLNFTVNQELPNLARKLRRYLKTMEMSFKVEIFDPNGTSLDADLEEEQQARPRSTLPQITYEDLTKRLAALQGPVAGFGPAGAPLKKAMIKVVGAIKGADYPEADRILGQIEQAIARTKNRPAKAAPPAGDAKALMARIGALKSELDGLPDKAGKAVRAALVQAVTQLQARDLTAAETRLAAAEKVVRSLAASPDPAPPEPDTQHDTDSESPQSPVALPAAIAARDWPAMRTRLDTAVQEATAAGAGDTAAIIRAFDYACAQADAGKHEAAMRAATATFDLIAQASDTPDAPPIPEAPALSEQTAQAVTTSRLEWTRTRSGLQAELIKLKMAIDAQTRGVSGLEDIPQQTGLLLEYIEELDTSLQDTLDALVDTSDGTRRQMLRDTAQQTIRAYRAVLDTAFFKAVDDNGFVSTAIRDTALTALQEVDTALAA